MATTLSNGTVEIARRSAMRQVLGALTGLVPIGVLCVDRDGRAWYRSQRWLDLTGEAPVDGDEPWFTAVHPDDRVALAERWRSAADNRGRLGTFRTLAPDGTERACRAQTVAMLDSAGIVDGYVLIMSDATSHVAERRVPDDFQLATPHVLDAVLDNAPDVITILNPDGSWRWSNGSAIRMVGHQQDFDPVEGFFSLVHADDVVHGRALLARALDGDIGTEERFEVRVRVADGTWHWMECILDVRLDDPAVRGIVLHMRDVTERRRAKDALEAAHRRLVELISSMHTGVVLENEREEVVIANQGFTELFHLPCMPDDLIGATLESLGVSARRVVAEPPDAERIVREIRRSGKRTDGLRLVLFDGRTIECDFVPVVVQGVDRGHVTTYRDVTGQARAEAERERLLASEQEENRRLAELDAFRSESIAAVSHELRTPLTSVVGYTQLLRSLLSDTSTPALSSALDAIERNVDRLLRLAGDVVALDSLESRTMPLPVAPVDVPALVRGVVETCAPHAAERSISLTVETSPGPVIHGDEDRLAQLFENLLSNAVKFTLPEGVISLHAAPASDSACAEWVVSIADSGIGIPRDELDMLFVRFFRASNARRRGFPGSGLGLAIARAIAERHRGTLSVESVVGVGTTVTVRIGSAAEHGHRERRPGASGAQGTTLDAGVLT
ncbi:MAG: PAS domain-containing sensor histidine kinase [Acidimicrobiales bacterium]